MKKKGRTEEAPTVLLGRFGSSLKMGIVGLPNVGKSTLFNVMTKLSIPAENYPFCTIDPNEARVSVPDRRFKFLCDTYRPPSQIPAFLTVTDIAGLVKGAAEGEGLGNAFLSHIRAVDGIFHVLRCFADENITHVEGALDPIRDAEIIHNELRLKDLEMVRKQLESVEKVCKRAGQNDKKKKEELHALQHFDQWLSEGTDIRDGRWTGAEVEVLNELGLISSKPVVYLVNLSEKDYIRKKNKWLPKIHEWVAGRHGDPIIPFSGALEYKLLDFQTVAEKRAYLAELKCVSALPKIIKTGFTALQLIYFFTVGEDEVRAWTIRTGDKAPTAAGKIHGDFEKGFIKAEVMSYEDFHELGSESAVKSNGKYRTEGKNYLVKDGDIILFKFNAGAGLGGKKK